MAGFGRRMALVAGTLLGGAAMLTPPAHAGQVCTVKADMTFSQAITLRSSTGDIELSHATSNCGGVQRPMTGWGYFGDPQPPLQGNLPVGFKPDTCSTGIEYLYLYAPAVRTRKIKLAPLWVDLTLTRKNASLSAAGTTTLGQAQSNLSGTGSFAPSTGASCLSSGWSGGSVQLSLSGA